MTKKIAHIILISFFTIFVTNFVVHQYSHVKKDSFSNVEELIEEEVAQESDDFLNGDFILLPSIITKTSFVSTNITSCFINLKKGINTPHGLSTSVFLDICVFRI